MNTVPLAPRTMVRAPGWPCDQISALKPAGSLILSSGIFSSGVTVGGVGCGLRFPSWPLAPGLVLSRGLKPGGDWATATASPIASVAAAEAAASRCRLTVVIVFLPVSLKTHPTSGIPLAPDRRTIFCTHARIVRFGPAWKTPAGLITHIDGSTRSPEGDLD